jgi:hypothetical protein
MFIPLNGYRTVARQVRSHKGGRWNYKLDSVFQR